MKVFRNFRTKSINPSRFSRYLLYAIGEIILVVIGILIALQINNWNGERLERQNELNYLHEISNNLKADSLRLVQVTSFNVSKLQTVDNMMQIFVDTISNGQRIKIFRDNSDAFVLYQVFSPENTSFNNLLNSKSIDLISQDELRKGLSDYYGYDYEGGIQERLINLNRKLVDDIFPHFFTKEYFQNFLNLSTAMPTIEDLEIHKNQLILSNLYGMNYVINYQNNMIKDILEKNTYLRKLISQHIESLST